jgi:hypothetical protein
MRSELENSAQIDRYLNQQMSGEELADFQQKLNDPAFQSEVEEHRLLHELVIGRGLIDLRKKLQALDRNESDHTNHFTRWATGILLVVIIGALTTYRFTGDDVKVTKLPVERNGVTTPRKTIKIRPGEHTIAASDDKKRKSATGFAIQHDTTGINTPATTALPKPDKITTREHQQSKSITTIATADTLSAKKSHVTPEIEKKTETKVTECTIATSELKIITVASCVDSPTGQVVIDGQSKLKGTAPFQFSINGEKYSWARFFTHLYAGNYILTVKDAAGCVWQYPAEIRIDENDCAVTEYAFYPDMGEVWKLPVTSATNGKIEIYNRNGSQVYTAEIVNGHPDQWDGATSDGQVLPMGSYSFILRDGGKVVNGQVTILK